MFGYTFYFTSIKKYVILFGTLFNDIWINREDNNNNVVQSMKVPLSYGPREKFLSRLDEDPNLDKPFAIVLPRMGFEITGYSYDASRKLNTVRKFIEKDDPNNNIRKYQYNPVPYNIDFQLSIFTKSTEDGLMIMEQILPYFTPEWTTTVKLTSDPEIILDIPLIINSVSSDDVYEGSYEERRALIHTIDFTMKGYLFGPIKKQGIIKYANTNFYDATLYEDIEDAIGNIDEIANILVYPGQTANGEATTYANSAIDPLLVDEDENWDYVTVITDPILKE